MSEIEEGVDGVDAGVDQNGELPASDQIDYQDSSDQTIDGDDDQIVEETISADQYRMMQKRLDEQERTIRFFQEEGRKNNIPEENNSESDPDDIATNQSVDDIVEKKLQVIRQDQNNLRIASLVKEAQIIHPDYQAMYEAGVKLVNNSSDPRGMEALIMQQNNPPELIYNLGLAASNKKDVPRTNVAAKVQKNLSKPNTLSQAGGQRPDTSKNYATMSSEEFKEIKRKIMLGQ